MSDQSLNSQSAIDYVTAQYAEPVVIKSAVWRDDHGTRVVVVTLANGDSWDVWSEPLMGGALYGEC